MKSLSFALCFLSLTLLAHAESTECKVDRDCKLLFDSCSCIAVPKTDSREAWDSGKAAQCKCNSCRCNSSKPETFVKAKCVKNKCQRSDSKR